LRTEILTLLQIVLANLLSGVASVVAAALLSYRLQSRLIPLMVSFSTGMLLGTAVLNLIPEAFESRVSVHWLAWIMLGGFVGFFVLEKALLLRHSHHHEGDGHSHHHGHDKHEAGPGGLLILVGDAFHNFADGVLIAAAFMADPILGWTTAAAVAVHEIPQEVGDFIVLLNAGLSRRRALAYNLVAALSAIAGGVLGYWLLSTVKDLVPLIVAFAASGFIYIALADLVPDLHRQRGRLESAKQLLLLAAGVAVAALASSIAHVH
jgi:zinc and cadmium transporter